jgi:DNA-binding transcriptional ArsR family regulator
MSEIILEKDKLKVISVESRINILKMLNKRRETLSDLSKKLNLSKPTLKEHLDILEKYGFIKKINSENIWKYYELTDQGKEVLNPSGIKILLLSISSFIISSIFLIRYLFKSKILEQEVNDNLLYSVAQKSIDESIKTTNSLDLFLILAIILFILGLGILGYYFYKKYKIKK